MERKTKNMVLCGLFAALLAACSQLVIPLPMISINLGLFAVYLAGAVLGARWGMASVLVFIVLGACGVPVFIGFQAGLAHLFGMTGGYILGYVLLAGIVGLWSRRVGNSIPQLCLAMALGTVVCYAFGTAWFMVLTGRGLMESLMACVLPFLPGDAVKIGLAAVTAKALERRRFLA